jgi:hypothetical protein
MVYVRGRFRQGLLPPGHGGNEGELLLKITKSIFGCKNGCITRCCDEGSDRSNRGLGWSFEDDRWCKGRLRWQLPNAMTSFYMLEVVHCGPSVIPIDGVVHAPALMRLHSLQLSAVVKCKRWSVESSGSSWWEVEARRPYCRGSRVMALDLLVART